MRFTIAAAALAGSASAAAQYGYPVEVPQNTTSMVEYPTSTPVEVPVYVTETVSSIETYCPGPTEITHGTKTYTVTEATTLTITDCPCTVTYPAETPNVPVPTSEVPVVPVVPSEAPSVPAYPIPSNGTVPSAPAPYPTGTGAPSKPTSTGPAEFPGAASSLQVGSSLVIAIGALAAFL